jgi:hypothetical protein
MDAERVGGTVESDLVPLIAQLRTIVDIEGTG